MFNKILSTSSIPQLQATFRAYATVSGHDIERAIESETSGDAKDAYLALGRQTISISCAIPRSIFECTHLSVTFLDISDDTA